MVESQSSDEYCSSDLYLMETELLDKPMEIYSEYIYEYFENFNIPLNITCKDIILPNSYNLNSSKLLFNIKSDKGNIIKNFYYDNNNKSTIITINKAGYDNEIAKFIAGKQITIKAVYYELDTLELYNYDNTLLIEFSVNEDIFYKIKFNNCHNGYDTHKIIIDFINNSIVVEL
jgi:hypothetical protein